MTGWMRTGLGKNVVTKRMMPSYVDIGLDGGEVATTFTAYARDKVVPWWLDIAFEEIGTKEILGGQDNPRILEYLSTVKLPKDMAKHDEIAWCAAFVNWSLKGAGLKGTN